MSTNRRDRMPPLVGYFTLVSMILNVAHTPAERAPGIEPLQSMPL